MPRRTYTAHGPDHLRLWLERLSKPSFVYVIQGDPDTPIKVGFAHDVEKRIASLQTGNYVELRLLHVLPGDPRLEWFLHRRLKTSRLRGEWFSPDEAFLEYVSDLAERMVEAYDGSGTPPHYAALDPLGFVCYEDGKKNPIRVTYTTPGPKVTGEEAEQMRKWAASRGSFEKYAPVHLMSEREARVARKEREKYGREQPSRWRPR
jgi:hypothetical protein